MESKTERDAPGKSGGATVAGAPAPLGGRAELRSVAA